MLWTHHYYLTRNARWCYECSYIWRERCDTMIQWEMWYNVTDRQYLYFTDSSEGKYTYIYTYTVQRKEIIIQYIYSTYILYIMILTLHVYCTVTVNKGILWTQACITSCLVSVVDQVWHAVFCTPGARLTRRKHAGNTATASSYWLRKVRATSLWNTVIMTCTRWVPTDGKQAS